jgi:extracellular matrix protein 14
MTLPDSLQQSYTPLLREYDLSQAIANSYQPRNPSSDDAGASGRRGIFAEFQNALNPQQSDLFFRDYQPLSAITNWMRLMVSLFPSTAELLTVGTTYEGRPIQGIRLSANPSDPATRTIPRQTILITGGSHAREWIGVSSVTYIAYQLMTAQAYRDSSMSSLLDSFDFVFIPTLNPDGYVYTWEYDRLWRKTRQPTPLIICKGMDLDRAYGYKWDAGSSRGNPCSESFAGENPFDAVEAGSFAMWARNETDRNGVEWIGFMDLHSYSQLVLYPYSYSCTDEPPSLENLEEVAWGLTKAIRHANGGKSASYGAAPACEGNVAVNEDGTKTVFPRMETGGGSALDWFYHELGVRYAYQIKLRDTGSYGFLLPRDYIVPVGKEALDAVVYLGKFLAGEWD